MSGRDSLASPLPARRRAGFVASHPRLTLLAFLTAVAVLYCLLQLPVAGARVRDNANVGAQTGAPQGGGAEDVRPTSRRIEPASVTKVNFRQLSEELKRGGAAATSTGEGAVPQLIPAPRTIQEEPGGVDNATATTSNPNSSEGAGPGGQFDQGGPLVPSPTPSSNYQAQEDSPKVGTGFVTIPPDTMGAVGLDKVFTTLNNNYRVHNKLTGLALSTVSGDTFWSSTGATGVFDPRVQYDPYQNRWLISAVSNAQTADSSVLVGVSDTSDPQGTYTLFRFVTGCAAGAAGCNAGGEWTDFPMLGFNKNWIAVGWNQFTNDTNAFVVGKMLVLDYPTARAGSAVGTIFNYSGSANFCMHPATTFSSTEETLYVPAHQQSSGALYRLHKITGTAGAPTFTVDTTARVRTGGGWTQPGGNNLPQQCVPGVGVPTQTCPATPRGLEAADSFIRSNVVFRNGKIWYPQSIALPAGSANGSATIRYAAQWTALNPDGSFSEGGRVEDPTATLTNGGKHYAYPSIGVNRYGDVMLGFSEFESDDYVDAGYAFRYSTDASGTMRDPVIYKEGEDYYEKTFGGTRNRWGDYSHTVVDPSNDRDMWTIQEYAALRTGTTGQGTTDSKWGTWWAKVEVPLIVFNLGASADAYVKGSTPTTNYGAVTELQVKRTYTPGNGKGRQAYLRFDTSEVPGTVSKATLRVFARLSAVTPANSNIPLAVFPVSTAWDEFTLTWNNKPLPNVPSELARVTVTDNLGRWYEFDITNFINQERAAGRSVTGVLLRNMLRGEVGDYYTAVNSREAAANQPQLVIEH